MAELTPHVAEARRAAAHLLWAAAAGGTLAEAGELMVLCNSIWPDAPLTIGKGCPLADTPSAKAWTNALFALSAARGLQGEKLGIDWNQRAEAERLIEVALGERIPAEIR